MTIRGLFLRCTALHRDACTVKDVCLKDWKIGYKDLRDTSKDIQVQLLPLSALVSFPLPIVS